MPRIIDRSVAQTLAEAYVEFLQKQRSIFFDRGITVSLQDEVIEKSDGYIFKTDGERPTYICVSNEWFVFTPTLSPISASGIVDSKTVSELTSYAFKKTNLGMRYEANEE